MKIKINDNLVIAGTPEEMVEFIRLYDAPKEKKEKPAEEKPKGRAKRIDWPKAEALKAAGWTNKAIADELGVHEVTISKHFREQKGATGGAADA